MEQGNPGQQIMNCGSDAVGLLGLGFIVHYHSSAIGFFIHNSSQARPSVRLNDGGWREKRKT